MLYDLCYPLLKLAAVAHYRYNHCLVKLKRRPSLLLKTQITPETHYGHTCRRLRQVDITILNRISPHRAVDYAIALFEHPHRMPCKNSDLLYLQSLNKDSLVFAGQQITVYRSGPGSHQRVLLVHGWEGHSVMFRPLAEKLVAQGYEVIAPDLLAHGNSAGERCSFYDLMQLLLMLGNHYGPFKTVIGHSFGGTAATLAKWKGLECHQLVNISSPDSFACLLDAWIDYHRVPTSLRSQLAEEYHQRYGLHPDLISTTSWKAIPVPTLICHDRDDSNIDLHQAYNMVSAFPDSQLFLTSGLGHRGILKDHALHQRIITFMHEGKESSVNTE
ncbi:alpha/beta fold hydrolase [Pectobacteriaceae bacterium CE70]|nr:alpha/beta fold hydrolase [Pectobacteriaceae bacterium C52]WJV65416.1 alpha/beta fold hydrolase [Pectobacteriaceae bacterium CE70]WJY09433.1 alpha/beta fold hydrolase [Pectobacteriaceae bacterium C80]